MKRIVTKPMQEVKLKLNGVPGKFYITEGEEEVSEMQINISGKYLTVYHTKVLPQAEGQGIAKKMMDAMIEYARKNQLNIIALCPFVHAQLRRHPEEYADV